jgi:hypothetical protein
MKDEIFHDFESIETVLRPGKSRMQRQEYFVMRRKPLVERQPGGAKRVMEKQQWRPIATAMEPHLSSPDFYGFFLTMGHRRFFWNQMILSVKPTPMITST